MKEIEVNKASMVGLKAELYRRKAEFDKEKEATGGRVVRKPLKNFPKKEVTNQGVADRNARDLAQNALEAKTLARSRDRLEEKARIYDQMKKQAYNDLDERDDRLPDDDKKCLVDFDRKALDESDDDDTDSVDDNEKSRRELEVYGATGEEDEWVEYEDDLGRTRKCLRKDLPTMMARERNMPKRSPSPTALAAERQEKRRKLAEEERELASKPVGPVYFQEVFGNEIRKLGVGYFGFSQDPGEREKQQAELKRLSIQ
eukprot:Ihof_evm16s37 gene=Ihof_evmTU16s37